MIVDYSTARPSMATLKAAGVTAAGRYIGWDSVPGLSSIGKNITKAEAGHLLGAGIEIFLAFEYAANAVIHGYEQGFKDATLASRQLHDLGAPPGMTVYFAVDFDIGDYAPHSSDPKAKLGPAAEYFKAVRDSGPAYQVGVYGGYYAVSRVLDAGLASMAWQTVAWSGGQWDNRAVLRQELGNPLAGADLDTVRLNTASGHDFGQWPRPPLPKPAAPELETHVTAGRMSLHDLAAQRKTTPMHILWLTANWGHWTAETYAWGNAVFSGGLPADSVMQPGLTLRCPVQPS